MVIGLQSTGEACLSRSDSSAGLAKITSDLEMTLLEQIRRVPLAMVTDDEPDEAEAEEEGEEEGEGEDADEDERAEIGADDPGNDARAAKVAPAGIAAKLATIKERRDALLRRTQAEAWPGSFLDSLLDQLGGKSKVAELSGRKHRIVRQGKGYVVERRCENEATAKGLNLREKDAFMRGEKLIAVIRWEDALVTCLCC